MGLATAAAGGGMGLNFVAALMKGQGDQASSDFQADKLERHAEYARTAADQTDAQLRENLNASLDNIQTTRAAQNIDPTSPTTAALMDRTRYIGDRARSIKVGNILAQAEDDENSASYLRQAGEFAVQTSWLSAAGGALSGLSKITTPGK